MYAQGVGIYATSAAGELLARRQLRLTFPLTLHRVLPSVFSGAELALDVRIRPTYVEWRSACQGMTRIGVLTLK
jgi:hypothetical protein